VRATGMKSLTQGGSWAHQASQRGLTSWQWLPQEQGGLESCFQPIADSQEWPGSVLARAPVAHRDAQQFPVGTLVARTVRHGRRCRARPCSAVVCSL
jgi:hypothetical protein